MNLKYRLRRFKLAEPPQVTALVVFAYVLSFVAGVVLVAGTAQVRVVYVIACVLLLAGSALGVPSAWSGRLVEWEQAAAAATAVGWLFYTVEVAALRVFEHTQVTPAVLMGATIAVLFFARAAYASVKADALIENPRTVLEEAKAAQARLVAQEAYRQAVEKAGHAH